MSNHVTDSEDQSATYLADHIASTWQRYQKLYASLSVPPADAEEERWEIKMVRQCAMLYSVSLGYAGRLIRDGCVEKDGRPLPPPPSILLALHDMQDSFNVLLNVKSYSDALARPLVHPNEIRELLDYPASISWQRRATDTSRVPANGSVPSVSAIAGRR